MRIIARKTLKDYWSKHSNSEQALKAWFAEAKTADWKSPNDVKRKFGDASIISNKRAVFNIKGNKYRLVVDIEYHIRLVFIVWVGTHKQYDKIKVKTVKYVKSN